MRDFKFFRGVELITSEYLDSLRQVQLTRLERREREQTINDAIRHEEYLHSTYLRDQRTESVVDWGRMAREIREQAQLREMVNRTMQQPNEHLLRYETHIERMLKYSFELFSIYDARFNIVNRPDGMSLERLAPIYGRIKDDIIMGGIIRYQQIRHRMMIDFEQHTGHRFAITEDTNFHLIQLSERE